MNIKSIHPKKNSGFTLVEMIGVLAVIAILASLLVPRVFQAIGDSKINNASSTTLSIKSAVSEYYGKYGKIAGRDGAALVFANNISEDWDLGVLVAEGFAEKPYVVRIGNGNLGSTATPAGSRLRVLNISAGGLNNTTNTAPASAAADLNLGAYDLDGSGGTAPANLNDVMGHLLVEAVIQDVDVQDAKAFNDRIDGAALGAASGSDTKGRVKYYVANGATTCDVRVYLAHK